MEPRGRRAQLLGQIVIYVIGLLVMSLVIVFGYQLIIDFQSKQCDVSRTKFATTLSTTLDRNLGWGTNRLLSLDAPCDTDKMCVIDRELIDQVPAGGGDVTLTFDGATPPPGTSDVMEGSVETRSPSNVFTFDEEGNIYELERFSSTSAPIDVYDSNNPDVNARCFQAQAGKFNLRLQGTGSLVRVSQYVPS